MSGETLLLVDDDDDLRFPVRRYLEARGFRVREAASLAAASASYREVRPDLALVDLRLPDGDGIDLLRAMRGLDDSVPLVMLTAHGSIDLAVRAIKEGAEQFLTKPVELPALLAVVERVLEARRAGRTSEAARAREGRTLLDPFVGESPRIRRLREEARRVAGSSVPVLLQGETGTGKGVLAAWLHREGPRSREAFVDVNCAGFSRELLESELFGHEKGAFTGAISKPGLLELAHRGTLFLDEISDMSLEVQPKLLKVVEEQRFRRLGDIRERRVDVRFIAATHRDLERLAERGAFREDLLYRINAVSLVVPPLRERGRDVVLLARALLARLGVEMGRPGTALAEEADGTLEAHTWPGNVRELRNVLERALLFSDDGPVGAEAVRRALSRPARGAARGGGRTLREVERDHIEDALNEHRDVVRAGAALGLSRSALYQKMRKHGLTAPPPGPEIKT